MRRIQRDVRDPIGAIHFYAKNGSPKVWRMYVPEEILDEIELSDNYKTSKYLEAILLMASRDFHKFKRIYWCKQIGTGNLWNFAMMSGLPGLQYLAKNRGQVPKCIINRCILEDHLEIVKWLHDEGYDLSQSWNEARDGTRCKEFLISIGANRDKTEDLIEDLRQDRLEKIPVPTSPKIVFLIVKYGSDRVLKLLADVKNVNKTVKVIEKEFPERLENYIQYCPSEASHLIAKSAVEEKKMDCLELIWKYHPEVINTKTYNKCLKSNFHDGIAWCLERINWNFMAYSSAILSGRFLSLHTITQGARWHEYAFVYVIYPEVRSSAKLFGLATPVPWCDSEYPQDLKLAREIYGISENLRQSILRDCQDPKIREIFN